MKDILVVEEKKNNLIDKLDGLLVYIAQQRVDPQ